MTFKLTEKCHVAKLDEYMSVMQSREKITWEERAGQKVYPTSPNKAVSRKQIGMCKTQMKQVCEK